MRKHKKTKKDRSNGVVSVNCIKASETDAGLWYISL